MVVKECITVDWDEGTLTFDPLRCESVSLGFCGLLSCVRETVSAKLVCVSNIKAWEWKENRYRCVFLPSAVVFQLQVSGPEQIRTLLRDLVLLHGLQGSQVNAFREILAFKQWDEEKVRMAPLSLGGTAAALEESEASSSAETFNETDNHQHLLIKLRQQHMWHISVYNRKLFWPVTHYRKNLYKYK